MEETRRRTSHIPAMDPIRLDDRLTRREFVTGSGLLLAAGLSGIYTCVLAPLYIASAIRTKSRRPRIYALLLTIATAVQLGVAT